MCALTPQRVVVVIPCYNHARFLPEAVESVCAQTYESLEIVIVDDGSPDNTTEVARRLAADHAEREIRLVRQTNQGLPASRNRGIQASEAEYILPLDADDKLAPEFVELCAAALDEHPECAIAYGAHQTFGDEGHLYPHAPYDFVLLTHSNQLGVASMFRRQAWVDVGGYNETMCLHHGVAYEDWDFWLGCAEHGHFGVHVPQALFYYRVRAGSMFGQVDDQLTKAHVVLNHPVLYSPEQIEWARGVIDRDRAALAIDGPRYHIPVLGKVRARPLRSGPAIDGARALATLARADELVEHPPLLDAYCTAVTGDDDATLVVVGEKDEFERLGLLLGELGHDRDDDADILGLVVEDPGTGLVPAAYGADAFLTERPVCLPVPLPRIARERVVSLRSIVKRPAASADGTGLPAGAATAAAVGHAPTDSSRRADIQPRATSSPRKLTRINDRYTIVHRGSEADVGVLHQIFVDEAYSLRRLDRWPGLRRFQTAGAPGGRPLIVDCGANIGASSVYFSILYPDARIVAVEPERENFELLCENVKLFAGIRPLHNAIASAAGTLSVCDPGTGEWGYRTSAGQPVGDVIGQVDAISVGDVLDAEPDLVPFILKVDVEGAEQDLFAHNTEALARFPLVIVELHDWMLPGEHTSDSFLRWHLSMPRDFIHYGENIFSIDSSMCA